MYRYLVQCWIKPKSGFDLARTNKIMQVFKESMEESFPPNEELGEELGKIVKKFEKASDGYVLEPLVLESTKEVTDFDKQLMPKILEEYPEAKLLTWRKMDKEVREGTPLIQYIKSIFTS